MARLPVLLSTVALACSAEATSMGPPLRERAELLQAVHPAPYRTVSEEEFELAVAALEAERDELGAARSLRQLLALVGDSHLAGALPQPDPADATFVPVLVRRVEGRYLVDACTDETLVGSELVALEGEPVEELLGRLARLATVDGDRPAVRLAEAERRFAEHLRLELGARSAWTLRVRDKATGEHEARLDGVPLEALNALERGRRSFVPSTDPMPSLEARDGYSVLRLASFGVRDREAYLAAVEALAPAIADAEQLVVDLRGNEGGDRSLGVQVARHLLDRPFTQWARVRARVRSIPERFAVRVSFPFAPEDALTGFPGERTGDGWVVMGDPLADTMTPLTPRYEGPLTLLVDDATNSAAIELAVALLAHHAEVRVVGTETQGECAWHIGQLPIVYDDERGPAMMMSLFEIELVPYPGCRPGRGIEPDLVVEPTLEDFLEGRDPYVRALQAL